VNTAKTAPRAGGTAAIGDAAHPAPFVAEDLVFPMAGFDSHG
jgi:hypothetical protein